ncbi:RHS repeat-associated core domain-containing protein [Pseudomonas sp. NPDC089569]|uniref:RHS repeat-associated core domain-containing protein n=1 Tax=Pseudomonas sp. NPDC089569 TaxID=3390722 RepID=UPI003D01575D
MPGETPSGYRYDPLDTLSGVDSGDGAQSQRFYRDGDLANQVQGANSSTFMRGDGVVLAEHQAGADPKSLMLAFDQKNSVCNEIGNGTANDIAYSAYGHPSAERSVSTHLGYNGEFREAQTGWQLLGNGYRAYNPVLMRFHSADSWSPFGEGGVNAYAYCEGDSINRKDPTGHSWYGNFLRLFRPTTTTAFKAGAPSAFLTNKKNTAASVRPIKTKDVQRLSDVVELRETQLSQLKRENRNLAGDSKYVKNYERRHGKRSFVKDVLASEDSASEILSNAKTLHAWAKDNVGKLGITRQSAAELKSKAQEFELVKLKIRRQERDAFNNLRQNNANRNAQRNYDNRYRSKPEKSYLGDGNS